MLGEITGALFTELRSFDWRGARGLEAAEATASVTLAVLGALALHADDPWWAGISTFVVSKAAFSEAVSRGMMCVAEVAIGTIASLIVCGLSSDPADVGVAPAAGLLEPPSLTFWRRDYGSRLARWLPGKQPLLLHACRGGFTVMLMPALADWMTPQSPVTIGVTVVMVMLIPPTAILDPDSPAIIQRAAHRLIGCLFSALARLAVLACVGSDFLLWVALIPPGIWLCSQIQTGRMRMSYIGTQAMFAHLMSLVQDQGPPDTISPGFERLVGVMGGLSVLFVVTLILSLIPLPRPAPAAAAAN